MPRRKTTVGFNELVKSVVKATAQDEKEVKEILELYFREIKFAVVEGKEVNIQNFGKFMATKWNMDSIYDINTGEKVTREIKTVAFKPCENFKKTIRTD